MANRFLKSLLKPQAYPEPTTSVHMLQTHISFIFITDSYVYKIKKPVDFGFLNFTTTDSRRFYCNEEVRLNRRLSPDLYLGVVEVRDSVNGATFCGDGRILDYAVKMKRLPEERMMQNLVKNGLVDETDIRLIARTIGEFHNNAPRSEEINRFGSIASIKQNWEESLQQISEYVNITLSGNDLEIINRWYGDFINQNAALLTQRVTGGYIRECDGDIHLDNICLAERVYIFDCIEFNQRFSCSDTAADISFLLMDLDFHRRKDLSALLMEEYLSVTGDRGLPKLVLFYKVYRAIIRGKVESFKLYDHNISQGDKRVIQDKARQYFRLARGYVLRQKLLPTLFITCGLMGSGKSNIAGALAFELGLDSVSSDEVRKAIASVPLYAHGKEPYGEGIYTPALTDATYGELLQQARSALENGRSIITDATFHHRRDRDAFRSLAMELKARFCIIQVDCPENTIRKRLNSRRHDPKNVSDGRWELFARQKAEMEPLTEDEGAQIYVDTCQPLLDTMNEILCKLGLLTCGQN